MWDNHQMLGSLTNALFALAVLIAAYFLSKWVINAAPGGVQMLPASEAGWLVTWTLPDDGFVLEWSTDLGDIALWNPSATVPISVGPLKRQAHIPPSELPPDSPSTFWRLTKQ